MAEVFGTGDLPGGHLGLLHLTLAQFLMHIWSQHFPFLWDVKLGIGILPDGHFLRRQSKLVGLDGRVSKNWTLEQGFGLISVGCFADTDFILLLCTMDNIGLGTIEGAIEERGIIREQSGPNHPALQVQTASMHCWWGCVQLKQQLGTGVQSGPMKPGSHTQTGYGVETSQCWWSPHAGLQSGEFPWTNSPVQVYSSPSTTTSYMQSFKAFRSLIRSGWTFKQQFFAAVWLATGIGGKVPVGPLVQAIPVILSGNTPDTTPGKDPVNTPANEVFEVNQVSIGFIPHWLNGRILLKSSDTSQSQSPHKPLVCPKKLFGAVIFISKNVVKCLVSSFNPSSVRIIKVKNALVGTIVILNTFWTVRIMLAARLSGFPSWENTHVSGETSFTINLTPLCSNTKPVLIVGLPLILLTGSWHTRTTLLGSSQNSYSPQPWKS